MDEIEESEKAKHAADFFVSREPKHQDYGSETQKPPPVERFRTFRSATAHAERKLVVKFLTHFVSSPGQTSNVGNLECFES
jgi:hypothetical protein